MRVTEFDSLASMSGDLAAQIALRLERPIAKKGQATIALSGGSTPSPLYKALSLQSIDWSKVTGVLVDERWTPRNADGSNERFIKNTLQRDSAENIKIIGLWSDTPFPCDAAKSADKRIRVGAVRPFDIVILGMGEDGHTASWFPHATGLDRALETEDIVCNVHAIRSAVTGPFIDRLTLTFSAIRDARLIFLLLSGQAKRAALGHAMGDGPVDEMPVRAVLRARPDMMICWAP